MDERAWITSGRKAARFRTRSGRACVRGMSKERGGRLPVEAGPEAASEEFPHIPALLAARRHQAQDPLDEPAAAFARRPAARFPPQDGVPKRPRRRVVRRASEGPGRPGGLLSPGLPQIRACGFPASGTSCHDLATRQYTEWIGRGVGSG